MGQFQIFNLILILHIIIGDVCTSAEESLSHKKHEDNMLWCRSCGVHVADITDSVNILSKGAIKVETRNILGRNITVQTLANPHKYIFDVLTTHSASCNDIGHNQRADSWFPGYTWRICTCPHCKTQLGWTFEKVLTNDVEDIIDGTPFHALMLTALLAVTNDSQLAELTTPYSKSLDLSTTTLPGMVPRASEDISKLPTTVSKDDIQVPKSLTDFEDTVTTKSEVDDAEGNIVVLKKRSPNTGIKSSTVTRTRSSVATHRDLL